MCRRGSASWRNSVAEAEYAESVQKARALFRAAEDAVRYVVAPERDQ